MAMFFLLILSIFLHLIFSLFTTLKKSKHALPPGPPSISHLGNLSWSIPSLSSFAPALQQLRNKYGPIVTLRTGSTPAIFISSSDLAYRTLVFKGQAFAFRLPQLRTFCSLSADRHTLNLASYNPQWQLLCHNISSFLNDDYNITWPFNFLPKVCHRTPITKILCPKPKFFSSSFVYPFTKHPISTLKKHKHIITSFRISCFAP